MKMFEDNLPANETCAAYYSKEGAYRDRQRFVEHLGSLLSMTREGILCAYLDENETVHVVYRNGYEKLTNVNADSYMAIIRDVTKNL